jgi:hypothetical protein
MHELCTYQVEVRGQVDENAFNASSPLQVTVVRVDADEAHPSAATMFTIYTDQSGLIGLIRHLHRLGFVLLSVYRKQ